MCLVCNDETQIKRYFFFEEFFSYFNGLNELACGRELHPVEGIFATRLLKRGFRRGKIEFRREIAVALITRHDRHPLRVYALAVV